MILANFLLLKIVYMFDVEVLNKDLPKVRLRRLIKNKCFKIHET